MMSSIAAEQHAAVRAGADLREARERLGLSLQDVARNLRIRLPHLEALEEGRLYLLPGNAYALAFVRTYARYIGLDADEMVRRFKAEAEDISRRTELVFPIPMPERGLPAGAIMLLGVVLAIGAYVGWWRLSGEGRLPAETVTAIPERLAPLAEQAVPAVTASSTPAQQPVTTDPADAPPADSANAAPPPASISPSSAAAALVHPMTATTAPVPSPDESRIVLRANALTWLMVKDRAGTVILNRTLKPGETWSVPPNQDLLLTTGNAGGTDVLVDGVLMPSLGSAGAVRRDLALDADGIKQGKLAPAATPVSVSTRPRP